MPERSQGHAELKLTPDQLRQLASELGIDNIKRLPKSLTFVAVPRALEAVLGKRAGAPPILLVP